MLGLADANESPEQDGAGNAVEQITDAVVQAAIALQLEESAGEAETGTDG